MKKLLLICVIIFALAGYSSILTINYISSHAVCGECHAGPQYLSPAKGSVIPLHSNSSFSCIDCHSQNGLKGRLEALETVAGAKLTNEMKPVINMLFQENFSFDRSFDAMNFAKVRANCEKCHLPKNLKGDFHTNNVSCSLCHFAHTKQKINFEASGIMTHKNLKCSACHGTETDIQIPSCTKCHEPHQKDALWDNSACLGCHNDAHVPTRRVTFSDNTPKEGCQGCHQIEYKKLTSSGGKHNRLASCASCHPLHGSKKTCWDCHGGLSEGERTKHGPHMSNTCNLCHFSNIVCSTCHEPHSPFDGLPRPATDAQIGEIAQQRLKNLK